MAQHDYTIANQTFPNTRADLNNVFAAIVSQNSGATAPSTTYAYMLWYDTTTDILKMRNANDDAWVDLFTIDQVADTATASGAGAAQGSNLIINGAMQVAQRGTSTSGTTGSGYFSTDRWQIANSSLGTWTVSQSTTAPDGFSNSFKMDCTTADASPASSDFLIFRQHVEAQNLQHLKFGTASAQSLTLSFWVRSSKTGTYIAELLQPDATNRHIGNAYTINSANTWEYKTITFAGDTSGVINNDNGSGFQVNWWLGAGSNFTSGTLQTSWGAISAADRAVGQVNLADSTSNDWYITGVQLEVGDTATPFDHSEDYGTTLAKCQRYYQKTFPYGTAPAQNAGTNGSIVAVSSGTGTAPNRALSYHWAFPVIMRSTPTVTTYNTSAANANWYAMPTGGSVAASILYATDSGINITNNAITTDNYAYRIQATVDAEL